MSSCLYATSDCLKLFKRDVIIASLHLTRCPTSCQPLQKRQGNKTLIPARFSFCCVLKVSLLHYINFRFCLCIFISGHLLLLYVYSLGQTNHGLVEGEQDFLRKLCAVRIRRRENLIGMSIKFDRY